MNSVTTCNMFYLFLIHLPLSFNYPKNEVCAVRGSTVVIPCTYVYPGKNHVQKMWCHHHKNCIDTKYVCHSRDINVSPEYKGRAECLGNEHQNCSLKVKNITDTDAGKYRFRFITNSNQWTGQDGVTLTITELRVSMKSLNKNGKIREGDSFNLTCATKGCSLSQSEFIWVKDKERLLETHSTLQFINVSFTPGTVFVVYSCISCSSIFPLGTLVSCHSSNACFIYFYLGVSRVLGTKLSIDGVCISE
uniref:Junctional adhesion molecule B-like n=1 Tax=Scleropages formosus TaxID=113540 RepID=A0A8C9SDJ7_SCLFO